MAQSEPKVQIDGFAGLLGVDSSVVPALIPPDKAAFSGNVIYRGGYPMTRPGFNQRGFTYPTTEIAEWFEEHIMQGAMVYQPKYGTSYIIASVGGRIFSIDPLNSYNVTEITPMLSTMVNTGFVAPAVGASVSVVVDSGDLIRPDYPITIAGSSYMVTAVVHDALPATTSTITVTNINATPGAVAAGEAVIYLSPNSPLNGRAWIIQAEFFAIIQDGQGRAIIWDGTTAFRSDASKTQIPTGTVMAYGIGRLWVAVNKNEFVASDIVRGSSGTAFYDYVDAILYFVENTFLAGGGAFSVPIQSGEITAMQFMPVLDTSTGNGPLIIFTERGAFSVNAPADRALWSVLTSPIQTVVLVGNGATSAYSTISSTNSDIFYRSMDGLRSFTFALREFTNSWGNTPISTELDRVLKEDDQLLLKYASAVQFDNRLWFTVQPVPWPDQENGAYHRGMATLDFHPISNMRVKAPPAYDGVQTGIRPTLLFKGIIDGLERCFCFSLNGDNHNELWEISKDHPFDNTDGRIESFVETRAFAGRSNIELKRLLTAELYLDDVKGTVDFTVKYKPDNFPCWFEWDRRQSICVLWRDCPVCDPICTQPVTYRPGYKTRLNFGRPIEQEELVDGKPSVVGYDFQFRIEWSGHCRLRRFIPKFEQTDEQPFPEVE